MTNPEIYFRRYSGSVEIRNFTGGNIVVRGTCELEDNSNGSTVTKSGTVKELVSALTRNQFLALK